MKLFSLTLGALMMGLLASPALADGYPSIPLYSGSRTVMDEDIAYPTTGKAHVNALIVVLAPGETTVEHRHGVPTFIHILEGEVTVDYGDRGKRTYKQGESFLEAMEVTHAGTNTGQVPVKAFDDDFSAATGSIEGDIGWYVERLRAHGFEQVIVIRHTRPEEPVQVVRVIVPGLEGYPFATASPGPRASAWRRRAEGDVA